MRLFSALTSKYPRGCLLTQLDSNSDSDQDFVPPNSQIRQGESESAK